jgi:hypothetical protein
LSLTHFLSLDQLEITVPIVCMGREVMILMRAYPLQKPLKGVGSEMAMSATSAFWAQKSLLREIERGASVVVSADKR